MTRFPRNLLYGSGARKRLLVGLNHVADSVSATLGPRGRNVAINRSSGPPQIVHDGVTVAKNIDLTNEWEDMGAQLIKEAASRTNETAGDGTTTATILAKHLAVEAFNRVEAGENPMVIRRDMEVAGKRVIEELKKFALPVEGKETLIRVATISSADPNLGSIVGGAINKVGKDGYVTVEEGKTFETLVEYKEGMEFDRGYLSPYFVTNQDRVEAVIEDPYILLTDLKLNHNFQLVPFLDKVLKQTKNVVIIAGEVLEEALATLCINRVRGTINVVAVQAPAFGGRRTDELEDLAAFTGGKVILTDSGRTLDSVEIQELGRADKFIADRDKSVILGGRGSPDGLSNRIRELGEQLALANTDYDRQIKKTRISNLSGTVAIVRVGAVTEVEMDDKKERVIDAVNATKVAMEDGVIAGGEVSLFYVAQMPFWKDYTGSGATILRSALMEPFKKLIANAGMDYAEVRPLLKRYPMGIDVEDGKTKDMLKSGIIDPLKVTKSALENAISVAATTLTTEVLISEAYNKK